jgi:hypothetical protein
MKKLLSFLVLMNIMMMFVGCNKQPKLSSFGDINEFIDLVDTVKITSSLQEEGEGFSCVKFLENLDENMFDVRRDNARIFSFRLQNSHPLIVVVFNGTDPSDNVNVFLDIMEETGEDLAKKYKGGEYIGFTSDCSLKMNYYGGTAEQVFNLYGMRFYVDNEELSETESNDYKNAYIQLIKRKLKKDELTDWDYYMFRNRFPEPKKNADAEALGLQSGPAILGTSALIEVLRVDWEMLTITAAAYNIIESFLKIPEERESIKTILEAAVYGVIWFDKEGKRVMAETLAKDKTTGEITKDRRWYNGYSMPKRE